MRSSPPLATAQNKIALAKQRRSRNSDALHGCRLVPNSLARIVGSEILSGDWDDGKDRSMLLTNCLFRMGGVALLLSSRVIVQVFAAAWVAGKACLRAPASNSKTLGVKIHRGGPIFIPSVTLKWVATVLTLPSPRLSLPSPPFQNLKVPLLSVSHYA
ncbi:hypothetical protein RJ640_001120 [Escallonia rubra]|uniref:FAE domain-containing protein n=1 Tax=Escallonia rubra TaxID=112253 RepID=A0AA88RUJ6_9ASTE|nr:hypothetical protein RJ640_001120 [Escallonia rubra]